MGCTDSKELSANPPDVIDTNGEERLARAEGVLEKPRAQCPVSGSVLEDASSADQGGCLFQHSDSVRTSAKKHAHINFSADVLADVECDDRPSRVMKTAPNGGQSQSVSFKKIVQDLYSKVLADERINHFYKGADLRRIFDMQFKIMTIMFGDEDVSMDRINDIDLRKAHLPYIIKMGLGLPEWECFCDHFRAVLEQNHAISGDAKERALNLIMSTKDLFRPVEDGELEKYGLGLDGRPL